MRKIPLNNNMESPESHDEKDDYKALIEILSAPSHYFEIERYKALLKFMGESSDMAYFDLLVLALNDPSRKVRMLAAHRIVPFGTAYINKLIPLLGEYSIYRRKYTAYILGFWNPEWKRQKYYEILRGLPIEERTAAVSAYNDRILVDSDFNRLFDAIYSLELIGDFRAIPLLKHAGKVFPSQIKHRLGLHDDYSVFLIILFYLQHPVDNHLKRIILSDYLVDLFRICQSYNYASFFENIFNELNLIGSLVLEVLPLSLYDKICRTLKMLKGSWTYTTMIWVLTIYYPSSIQTLDEIKKDEQDPLNLPIYEELRDDLLSNFKVRLNSGLNLYL